MQSALDGRVVQPARPAQTEVRQTLRIAALQAAATFAAGKALNSEVSTADVLKVAAAFERWLLEVEGR